MTSFLTGKGVRALPRLALVATVALAGAACNTDNLVTVGSPASLRPEDLTAIGLGAVPQLVNGAFRQFISGYDGLGGDSFLSASAVLTDETYYGDTFPTRLAADTRNLQPPVLGNISDGAFNALQQARFNARRAFGVVDQFTSASTASADSVTRARLRAIEGYVYVTLSEGWCGDVPFSKLPDTGAIDPNAIEGGVGLTTGQMNDTAVTRFDQALGQAQSATTNENYRLAAVGKGRALLNLGKFAEAKAAVASVPTNFVFLLQHSQNTAAENNPMYQLMANGRYGVSNLEGGILANGTAVRVDTISATTAPGGSAEGLPFRGLMDIRVLWEPKPTNGRCFTTSVFCKFNDNYPNNDADVPLASGVEARLIEAEAQMQAGDFAGMTTTLNALRANAPLLLASLYPNRTVPAAFKTNGVENTPAPLVAPLDATSARTMLFTERALWLFNTGHRLGDLRRLSRPPYGLPTTTTFPTGPHFRTGNYGNDVNYPVPFAENNNINFNPSACVTTVP